MASAYEEEGTVQCRREMQPNGLLMLECSWMPDGVTGNAVKTLPWDVEGSLEYLEYVYSYALGGFPASLDIALLDEYGGTDWLDGRGAGIDPTAAPVPIALYESHGSERVARTPIMGRQTLSIAADTGNDDRGIVRIYLRPYRG